MITDDAVSYDVVVLKNDNESDYQEFGESFNDFHYLVTSVIHDSKITRETRETFNKSETQS